MKIIDLGLIAIVSTFSMSAYSDFIVIPKERPRIQEPEVVGPPVTAFLPSDETTSEIKAAKPPFTEVGDGGIKGSQRLESAYFFELPLAQALPDLIPNTVTIRIANDLPIDRRISFNTTGNEGWVTDLESLFLKENLFGVMDWERNTLLVGVNPERTISLPKSAKDLKIGEDTFVIRKKSDDLETINSKGFLLKDGQALRFKSTYEED